jgi:hypothetical protein
MSCSKVGAKYKNGPYDFLSDKPATKEQEATYEEDFSSHEFGIHYDHPADILRQGKYKCE